MTEDCDELQEELNEREEKALNLFKEAEKLHQKALRIPATRRADVMSEAFAKQKEAIEEIHVTEQIKDKISEKKCEETPNQTLDLLCAKTTTTAETSDE